MAEVVTIHTEDPRLFAVLLNAVAEETGLDALWLNFFENGVGVCVRDDALEVAELDEPAPVAEVAKPKPPKPAEIETPWPCDNCDYVGKSALALRIHNAKSHGDEPVEEHVCSCGQVFTRKNGLSRHQRQQGHGASQAKPSPAPKPASGERCSCGLTGTRRELVIHSRAAGHTLLGIGS